MGFIFDPDRLGEIAHQGIGLPRDQMFEVVLQELVQAYGPAITPNMDWVLMNAGGVMGQMVFLHCSLSEYVLFFGTPIGTEGHSGRYAIQIWDWVMSGEMWDYEEGQVERTIYRPGDTAYHDGRRAKGYRIPDACWMLEYGRGPIVSALPFGVADTVLSTLDWRTLFRTLAPNGRRVVQNLLRGKI